MTPGLNLAVQRWREVALAIVTSPDSTPTQRQLAWQFLKKWGVA